VAAATASDGAGSIRIPAACTNLVGLKPGPGVVPTPLSWNGLSTYGFVTRTTEDSALLYGIEPAEAPRSLRIAWSLKPPLPTLPRPDETMRGALEAMRSTLQGLGHSVDERDPDWGMAGPHTVTRYLRGIADDAKSMALASRLRAA
jgi:amidase